MTAMEQPFSAVSLSGERIRQQLEMPLGKFRSDWTL